MNIFELYERRIDNAMYAANNCKEDSWGQQYWHSVAAALLRKLNRMMNEGELNANTRRH